MYIWTPEQKPVLHPGGSSRLIFPGERNFDEAYRLAGLVDGGLINRGHAMVNAGIIRVAAASGLSIPAPTVHYPLDESSGDALDTVGGLTLTDTNTVTSAVGPGGSGAARQFTAANVEYFTRADNAAFQLDTNATIAIWAYIDSKATYRIFVMKSNGTTFGDLEYQILYLSGNNQLLGSIGSAAAPVETILLSNPSVATWYCCAMKWDGTNLYRSLNGAAWDSGFPSGYPRTTAGPFRIGARSNASLPMDGRLARMTIWKGTLLSNAQIATFYNGGVGATYNGSIWA